MFVSWTKIVNFLWSFFGSSFGASLINTYFSPENYQLMHNARHRHKNGSYILCALTKTKTKKYSQVRVVVFSDVIVVHNHSQHQWSWWNLVRPNDAKWEKGGSLSHAFQPKQIKCAHRCNNTNETAHQQHEHYIRKVCSQQQQKSLKYSI